MLRRNRTFPYCIAFALLGLPGLGHAYSACVGTSEELDAAMAEASATSDASIAIKIREGNYVAGNGNTFYLVLTHSNQTASISGGWSGAACENRRFGAQSGTVLVGSLNHAALRLDTGTGSFTTIDATDLTLRNVEGTFDDAVGACLHVLTGAGTKARVYRALLDGCVGASAAIMSNASGELTFANSVIQGGFNAGAPVRSLNYNNAVTRFAHLTITGNTATSTSQDASGLSIFTTPTVPSQVRLDNSVIWGGVAPAGIPDIATDGPGIVFTRAHYDTLSHVNATVTDNAPSHGDPGFTTPTNPRLRSDSPLVDSGVTISVGDTMDADGDARTQGAAVDVGAYETNPDRIFADGFDR